MATVDLGAITRDGKLQIARVWRLRNMLVLKAHWQGFLLLFSEQRIEEEA
jgi:hypothetical protein